jgi:hypothetical protein
MLIKEKMLFFSGGTFTLTAVHVSYRCALNMMLLKTE